MRLSNFAYEQAELRADQEREAGIAAARSAISGAGSLTCKKSGDEIEPERRAVLPSATRCTDCQTGFERMHERRRF